MYRQLLGVLLFGLLVCLPAQAVETPIRVAVFEDAGTGKSIDPILTVLAKFPNIQVRRIKVADIRAGALTQCDVLLHPGGSGSVQGKALGEAGREQVRAFVRRGGGYVGICAGAYLATRDYPWSLHILNAKVVDKAHWARGWGEVELTLTPAGQQCLGLKQERVTIYYHQGPLLAAGEDSTLPEYEVLARFAGDIAQNKAPQGVMPGTTAIARGRFGQGRVICFSPHPEKTPPLVGMVQQSIRWAAGR
jgi:glutamine amidotransferase-like uncharacterized protein